MSHQDGKQQTQLLAGPDHDVPGLERWLVVSLSGFVPIAGLFVVPRGGPTWALVGAAVLLLAAGLAMLAHGEMQRAKPR